VKRTLPNGTTLRGCEVPDCPETDPVSLSTILRTVSLAAFGDDDRAVDVCGRHFDQWALGIREKAVPTWVAHMLRERIR
jgi:hypothetical protein